MVTFGLMMIVPPFEAKTGFSPAKFVSRFRVDAPVLVMLIFCPSLGRMYMPPTVVISPDPLIAVVLIVAVPPLAMLIVKSLAVVPAPSANDVAPLVPSNVEPFDRFKEGVLMLTTLLSVAEAA